MTILPDGFFLEISGFGLSFLIKIMILFCIWRRRHQGLKNRFFGQGYSY